MGTDTAKRKSQKKEQIDFLISLGYSEKMSSWIFRESLGETKRAFEWVEQAISIIHSEQVHIDEVLLALHKLLEGLCGTNTLLEDILPVLEVFRLPIPEAQKSDVLFRILKGAKIITGYGLPPER